MSEATTFPPIRTQYPNEDIVWQDDLSLVLVSPQMPTSLTTVLLDKTTNLPVILPDPPTVIGTSAFQRVRGGILMAGHLYRLIFTFTPSGTSNIIDSILTITCLGF